MVNEPIIGWLCFDCWEVHTNEDHRQCGGAINDNPVMRYGCPYCGFGYDTRFMALMCHPKENGM